VSEPRGSRRRHHGRGYRLREFLRRLAEKCDDDEVLFMAGAIAFNLIVALFPLLVLGIGIAGYVLARFGDPTQAALALIAANLPQAAGADLTGLVQGLTERLLERRAGYTIAGSAFLLWMATRLSGSLRVALRETFDIGSKRNPIHGKIFDIGAVAIGMLLLTLNLGVTVVGATAVEFGVSLFGVGGAALSFAGQTLGFALSFVSIWVLLLMAYRYMPARPIEWRTAVVAATFAAFSHESLKFGFSWYATEVADYRSALGNLTTVAILFFWIYYESLVFILGGEVAQVYMMRRASRVGVESFETET
jgi:membrane protein